MTDGGGARIGAVGATLGGFLLLVGNVIHPREEGQLDQVEALLAVVAGSEMWAVVHTMLLLGVALLMVGYVGLTATMTETVWPRLGLGLAIVGTAMAALFMTTEAVALPPIAEVWAAASNEARQSAVTSAVPLFHLSLALSAAAALFLFGLTPLAMGKALVSSALHPSWLGWVGIGVGILGVGANLYQILTGVTTGTALIVVPISIVAATVWVIALGVHMWRRWANPRVMVKTAATSA